MHIDDLGHDILWEIFLMNADLEAMVGLGGLYEIGKEPPRYRYSPLTVTRRTSQVCRSWRQLILTSSSIWGRVIHLDFLDQDKSNWRSEVVRRTGQAPLYLKGDLVGYQTEDFFLGLLETEWARIRRIDVRLYSEYTFEEAAWEPLLRPTSTLESFNLGYSFYRALSIPRGKLFGDSAPQLREFYSTGIPFKLNYPWISQLQHLTVSSPFSIPEILHVMKKMPFLASIRLESGVRALGQITEDIQHLSLPQLKNIVLTGYLSTGLQFLECISPSLGCGLSLDPNNPRDIIFESELERAIIVFARYSYNYFSVYHPKRLLLSLTEKSFYMYDLLDPIRVPSSPSFKFLVRFGNRLAGEANSRFLRSLMQSPLSSLTLLEILQLSNAIEPSDPDFVKFATGLPSLQILQINSLDVLGPLRQIPIRRAIPFPSLRTLKVVQSTKLSTDSLESFLSWRRKCGVPIRLLDLTFCSVQLLGNLGYLESFKGMKVRWSEQFTTEEHICGRSALTRLNFGDQTQVLV